MAIVPRWEWRAFGDDFGAAERRLAAGDPDALEESDEAYILSAAGDASIKLRGERMDVKRLERVDDDGLEQWRPVLKASFPLKATDVATIKAALAVDVAGSVDTLDELLAADPGVMALRVQKRRCRYTFGGCMAEVTEFVTEHGATRTLAVESEDPSQVLSVLRDLGLDGRPNICVARGLKALVGLDGDRYAVIDVGTNSVKLHIAERQPDGGWRTLADRAEITRLGEGLGAGGRLGAEPIGRTVETIGAMARETAGHRVRAVAAVGTAGLRIAENAGAFLDAVHERTGLVVDVLTGDDEARLAARAATAGLAARSGLLAVFDTGGGSSQFTFARGGTVEERFSVDVGAVRLTREFGLASAVPATRVDEVLRAVGEQLERLAGRPRPATIVGLGGAVTNLAAIRHGLRDYEPDLVHGTVLDVGEIDRQIALLRERDAAARAAIPGLQPARADVILAGACIVRAVIGLLGGDAIVVSDRGLRHGVLAERFAAHDPLIGHGTRGPTGAV
jgi:exopolyphosphatase/guanosine-5'-triphosphate,3'-diphosphate pyrophosphatase